MESYGYKTSDIIFNWDNALPPIDITGGIRLPNHRIRGHFVNNTPKYYETGEFTSLSGKLNGLSEKRLGIQRILSLIEYTLTTWFKFIYQVR